ncbi:MAG: hypothetical protein BGO98_02190 [Myxococcales bacterium 68-20]|nr:MAG: hypothetical protein BGO98_02190 [Myxococcales bacterium 68-20]
MRSGPNAVCACVRTVWRSAWSLVPGSTKTVPTNSRVRERAVSLVRSSSPSSVASSSVETSAHAPVDAARPTTRALRAIRRERRANMLSARLQNVCRMPTCMRYLE